MAEIESSWTEDGLRGLVVQVLAEARADEASESRLLMIEQRLGALEERDKAAKSNERRIVLSDVATAVALVAFVVAPWVGLIVYILTTR